MRPLVISKRIGVVTIKLFQSFVFSKSSSSLIIMKNHRILDSSLSRDILWQEPITIVMSSQL